MAATHSGIIVCACISSAMFGCTTEAQGTGDADELAKQLSNPVAALISVPLQFNQDDGIGPTDSGERYTLNIQPVVPIPLNESWNLISRTIVPLISQSDVAPGGGSQSGIGDITQSVFFSPKASTSSGWIWGAGPALLLPAATDDALGTEQWAAGPTAVVLKQQGPWTYGALANHLWRFAGSNDKPDVDATFLQPFLSRALGQGQTVTGNFEATYDWTASQWTAPMNLTYSKVTVLGTQRVSIGGGIRYYVERPESAADWGVRLVFTFLFPR